MGAWGILERQSDNGLDLLDLIVAEQLKKADFATFNVAEAIKLLNDTTKEEIEQYQKKPKSEVTDFYINECLMHNFTHAAVLVAECLADYYQTGELIVYDYVGENYGPVKHRIKDFIVTNDDLQSLLEVLQSVQNPEHWRYQCWVDDETCQRWLTHIQSVYADGKVVDADGGKQSSNGLYWSNSEGKIVISNITGTVIATEVASPEGFAIDPSTQTQTVVINPGDDTQHLYFYNTPLCSLVLTKLDSLTSKPVANVTFSVKDGNGNLIGRYTTGKDGTVTVTGLLPGSTVVVSEYKVPDNYVLDTTPQTITLKSGTNSVTSGVVSGGTNNPGSGNGNDLTFENDPKMVLTIHKYIKGTDFEPLKGVCFKIVDGYGKPIGTNNGLHYTNSAGEIVLEDLEPGTTVTAREISSVAGYVMDGEPQTITIQASKKPQEMIFWNEKAGSVIIQKLDSVTKKPLSNVQFLLTYADGSYVDYDNGHMSSKGLYQTDSNGEIRISGVTGTIIAKELKTLPGYTIDPATQTQTVQVNPNDTQYLVFYNTPVGNFELIKSVEGNESKRIPNVTFEIRRASDGGLVDTITTGSDGRATLQLDAGNYYAVETKCPSEFKLDSTPHYFTMKEGGKGTTLPVTNKAISGITLHKTDSVTGKGIYGVTFLLYDSNHNLITQESTDNQGYAYFEDLTDGGRYYLRELENEGYIPDTELKTVVVKSGESTLVEWKNTPITAQIQITKKSADYLASKEDKSEWVIDKEAAAVVQRIFQMVMDGESVNGIARTLRAEQVPIPSEHWKRIGAPVRAASYHDPYAWSATTLSYILKRPEYLGRKVLGKTVCENYKTKSTRKTAPEEQFVFEGAVPAIIDEETWHNVQRLRETMRRTPKRSSGPNRLTGLLYCADCGAKLTHHNSLVQGKYIDDAFTCSRYRGLTEDCTIHYVPTQKLETAILSAIQRISWYVRNNEQEFVQRVREASSLRQEEAAEDCRKQVVQAKKRHAELDGLVKKLYEANAMGKLPDKHFSRLLTEYDEEQAALEVSMAEWQGLLDNWNADKVKMAEFIDLAKRYTDFSELTTPMLNEFIEKIIVHEGIGRGNQRRQRLDFYFNFIGAFEVPANIVTPMEQEAAHRQQAEQAEKEERSQALAQARYEKRKKERREFTARKRAGLLTPEEQEAEDRRLEHNRAYQKKQRDKKKASQPEKPRKRTLEELAKLDRSGADLTPEEAERLATYKQRKAEAVKRCREKQKATQPPKPQQRTLKELTECAEAGLPLTSEEAERLETHRNRKKAALQDLKARAETDPAAAEELARRRAYQSDATKKSRQKMYEDVAAGDPEAQARYERFLATRRENYHRKKQEEVEATQAS